MCGGKESLGKRHRHDSILNDVMDQYKGYKRMKVGDKKWAKVDKLIRNEAT